MWDATGCELPAALDVSIDHILVTIDDRDAVWPILIEPTLSAAPWSVMRRRSRHRNDRAGGTGRGVGEEEAALGVRVVVG